MIDVVFIVDDSGSICFGDPTFDRDGNTNDCNNWKLVKNFILLVIEELVVGERDAHVALVQFSTRVNIIFDLNR